MGILSNLGEAMRRLAEDPGVVFLGQSVVYKGQRAHQTFEGIDPVRKIELPIAEDFSVGFAAGLSMAGFIPVLFIPRWDFLLCAANQIVNHLDAMGARYGAKVIIRTAIGASAPLDPGPQHTNDCSEAFRLLLQSVEVICVGEDAVRDYECALRSEKSFIMVERMSEY